MGWLWSSSTTNEAVADGTAHKTDGSSAPANAQSFGLTQEQRGRLFGKRTVSAQEEQTDKDLETFLSSLSGTNASASQTDSPRLGEPSVTAQQSSPATNNSDRLLPDGSVNIHPHALYPRTMTCRHAFDQAFYCQSLGGKFNDIYRFGHVQPCSEQWGAFWFCMRTRTLPAHEREELIRKHYAEREARKTEQFGSSEQIWEMRTEGVRRAFQHDPDAEDADLVVKE